MPAWPASPPPRWPTCAPPTWWSAGPARWPCCATSSRPRPGCTTWAASSRPCPAGCALPARPIWPAWCWPPATRCATASRPTWRSTCACRRWISCPTCRPCNWPVPASAWPGRMPASSRCTARMPANGSAANSPDRIARLLLAEGLGDDYQMAVAENLLQAEERLHTELSPAQAATLHFAELNVVLLWRLRRAPQPLCLGLPDSAYEQRQPDKGLITKQEVRAVSLARLQLRPASVVWDIGAGSGSVGLEAARLCRRGHVWAIEKNEADHAIASRNHARAGLSNYSLQLGRAPEGLGEWPDPDAVFIGGSGGELAELIALVLQRLRPGGHLVMNFVTLENLATATAALQAASAQAAS